MEDTLADFKADRQRTRKCYHREMNNVKLAKNRCAKWGKRQIQLDLDGFVNRSSWNFVTQIAIATKYRNFHRKMLCGALMLNNCLFHAGLVDSKNCTFGCDCEETLRHHLFECIHVNAFWNLLWTELPSCLQKSPDMSEGKYLCNNVFAFKDVVYNFLILAGKYYLYCCKCQNKSPRVHVFLPKMLQLERTEFRLAFMKRKIGKHKRKWGQLGKELWEACL